MMEKKSLYIYKLDEQGNKVKFPNSDMPAKLGEYTYSAQRMAGTPTLTATLNYPSCLDDLWSGEEFVEFRGEKYYVGQIPTSSKDNKSIMYKHELQFVSERIVLENVYFMDVVTDGADTYHSNSTSVKFMGDIHEFVGRLNASMTKSGIGYSVVIDDEITSDSKLVSLDNVYLSDALQSIYTIYELPYYFVGKVCHIGYTENVISTPFEYRKGLVSIKKTNANYKIVNRVTGVGSSDNIPFYYPNDDETGTIERSQNLMPSIYRQTSGADRFYNALNDTYNIPGKNDYYSFKNTYSAKKVKEIKVDFSDIKPTIEGVTNASGQLFGEIADIAFDANDSDELGTGEGNNVFNGTDEYVHSYFYIKLHIYNGDYGFNLFEQGLEGGTAVINMTTGNCAACEFEIGVTYKEGEKRAYNPVLVDSNGNLPAGDFEQKVTPDTSKYVARQQNTSTNDVWIAVKKDNSSFGVVMPNATNNYKPSVGDKFVITGIKMPKSLVLAAEKRLEEALIKYMSENNDEKFMFSVNFSRVFLAENTYLWDILNENARIYIKYNNREYLMYVNSYTCKADKNCLYDISVELNDKLSANVSALRSTITEIAGDIIGDKIGSGGNVSTSDILSKVSRHFLSKRHDDRTPHKLSSDTAFEIGEFVSGSSGAIVYKDKETGQTVGELDKLRVRMKAYFETLEIINVNSVGGKQIISPAGSIRVNKVEETETSYKCYFLAEQEGEKIENRFIVGDQGYCQVFNAKTGVSNNISNHYYWRLVIGVGGDYIELSKSDCDTGSGVPVVGDIINQRGNRNDVDRQNALEFSSVDAFSPSITLYQGINSYSLVGKDAVSYGVDKTTGKAFMNVYGEMYIGDRVGNTFVRYTQANGVEIKGKLAVGTKLGDGKTIEQALEDATQSAIDTANENISNFTDAVTKDIEDLQNQIDGAIETWFNDPEPTLTNYPANGWTTNEEKNIHLGDLYYSGEGKAYRFQMDGSNYVWKLIIDSDITKALSDAAKAQDTADGKRRVFVTQPANSEAYDVGDLWVNATYGTTYSNDVLRAVTAKAAGSPFSINHWTKASKYTDDTKAEQVQQNVNNLSTTVSTLSGTVSGMKDFTDEAFADGIVDRSEASAIDKYLNNINTTKADVQNAYSKVYENALLDGVGKTNLANAYNAFSASATELVTSISNAIADDVTTSTERADVDAKYTNFNMKYGNFVAYLNAANKYIQDKINATANDALTQIGGLAYLKKALKEDTTIEGGLIQSSVLALGYTNENNVYKVMSGTNGIYDAASLGGGIASWWGGAMKDRGSYTESNMPSDVAKALIRMDGSGYLANGGIWWGTDRKIHADPQSFIINENQLGDYLELFQIIYKGGTKEIDYIIPQYVMQKVEVATSVKIGNAYLKYDAESNSIYVEGEGGEAAGFWTKGFLSSKGLNPGTGGGTDYDRLDAWSDYTADKAGYVLSAGLGNDLNIRLKAVESGGATSVTTTGSGNVVTGVSKSGNVITVTKGLTALTGITKAQVEAVLTGNITTHIHSQYLTSHQTIYDLTIQGNGTTIGVFDPNGAAKTINITPANIGAATAGHNHNSAYVTALGTSGNYLTWTKNGVTNNITVPYASNADMLDGWHLDNVRKGVLRFSVFKGSDTIGGYDLNTLAPDGGIVVNYGSNSYWGNEPQGAAYGISLHIANGLENISGMLFADINHNSATDVTRNLWWRVSGLVNGAKTWGLWHQIAFTDSNVASATKLKTARSIFGNSFDGTSDVMQTFKLQYSGIAGGNAIHKILNYSQSPYGLLTRIYSDGSVSLQSQREANNSEVFYLLLNPLGGNVGIGTASPSQKLDVAGHINARGYLYSVSSVNTLQIGSQNNVYAHFISSLPFYFNQSMEIDGNCTPYTNNNFSSGSLNKRWSNVYATAGNFSTHIDIGAIRLSYDSTNNAIKVSKTDGTAAGLYAEGFLSAKGLNPGTGGSGSGGTDYDRLDAWSDYAASKAGWVLSAGLGNDLNTRLKAVEQGGAMNVTTTGSGNAITAITKTGTTITANKGATFSLSSHTHSYLPLSGGTITGALGKSNNYLFKPNGGDYRHATSGTVTGAICISLPANIGNTMLSMWIDVYNYVTNTSFSVHVGGYTYNNSTFVNSPFAMVYGATHKIHLTYDNGFKIYIGETNSIWNYPQVSVRDVVLGYHPTYSNWLNSWSVSFVTAFPATVNASINNYAYTNRHKPSFSDITSKPTTLAGYGITDAKIAGGVITLGANSITPLTSHQSLADYVTLDTLQTITGRKIFTSFVELRDNSSTNSFPLLPRLMFHIPNKTYTMFVQNVNGLLHLLPGNATSFEDAHSPIVAGSFHKYGGTSSQFLKADGSVDDNSYLTTGTASSTYVKKAGDTMTGILTAKTNASHSGVKLGDTYLTAISGSVIFQNNSAIRFGADAWDYNVWAGLKYNSSNKYIYLGLADGTIFTASSAQSGGSILTPGISNIYVGNNTTNKVWHAGNDGSGSGLDADKLDGLHSSSFLIEKVAYCNTTSIYDLRHNFGSYDRNDFSSGQYYGEYPSPYGVYLSIAPRDKNSAALIFIDSGLTSSTDAQHVFINTRKSGDNNTIYNGWNKLAYVTDNVASATKLAAARTLWGQSFNGTANVSGNITGVGSITPASDSIYNIGTSSNQYQWIYAKGIFAKAGSEFSIGANNAVHITFTTSGNVGIGTASPSQKLDVAGHINARGYLYSVSNGNTIQIGSQNNSYAHFTSSLPFYFNQSMEISGNCTPYNNNSSTCGSASKRWSNVYTQLLDVSGNALITGVLHNVGGMYSDSYVSAKGQNTSDYRLKTDIKGFNATAIIRSLRPVSFRWNDVARRNSKVFDTDDIQYGLIAQEVKKVAPWAAVEDMFGDGYMGVRYEKFIPVLMKAQIETLDEVEGLKRRLSAVERENERLKKEIQTLKAA